MDNNASLNGTAKVAVLLATYNGGKYLGQQLDSLIGQSYRDFCCYIHDDGSSDDTMKIVEKYMTDYPERIRYVEGASRGGSKDNFLYLMESVDSDYYMFCDQDDVWLNTKIQDTLDVLRGYEADMPLCAYTDLKVVDADLNEIDASFYASTGLDPTMNTYRQLLMSNVCVGCTMLFNRAARDKAMAFDSEHISMHDWKVALAVSLFGKLVYCNRQTVLYRQHGNNVLGATRELNLVKKIIRAVDLAAYRKRRRFYLERPRKIAGELSELPDLPGETERFLVSFSKIGDSSKITRIGFYKRNALYRQRINRLWQLIEV